MGKMENDMMFKAITGYPDQTIQTVPTLHDSITLTAVGGGLWANGYGAAATILASGSNTSRLKILGLALSGASAADEFQVALYEGTTLKAEVPITVETAVGGYAPIMLPYPVYINSGTDIKGKVACKGAAQRTLNIKLIVSQLV